MLAHMGRSGTRRTLVSLNFSPHISRLDICEGLRYRGNGDSDSPVDVVLNVTFQRFIHALMGPPNSDY